MLQKIVELVVVIEKSDVLYHFSVNPKTKQMPWEMNPRLTFKAKRTLVIRFRYGPDKTNYLIQFSACHLSMPGAFIEQTAQGFSNTGVFPINAVGSIL